MSQELIAELANLALTLSLIVAIIFGIAQVATSKRERFERLTLQTLSNFQTRDFADLTLFITTSATPKSFAEWQTWPREDRVRFIEISQQMESLGILLADKFIDLTLVDKTLGSFVVTIWKKFEPLILDMRQKLPDPYLNEYFQWMADQIDKRMKENPRKPFFESATTAV